MTVAEILRGFAKLNILVVGDVCLDRWCTYDPELSEASRETGIPRVAVVSAESTAGASGTIANNLADLGVGRVAVMGVIGEDLHGDELFRALGAREIGVDLMVRSKSVQTFTYTKYLNRVSGVEDLPRVDYVNAAELNAGVEAQLVRDFSAYAHVFDAVLVCDQAETAAGGVITAAMRAAIAAVENKVVWVDSRRRAELFERCYLKPNADEAREAAARAGVTGLAAMRERLRLKALVVTDGARGARVIDSQGERLVAGVAVGQPVDICGAGDSFSAGAAAALAVGATIDEAVRMGNLVASVTVMKRGTGTASQAEVLAAAR